MNVHQGGIFLAFDKLCLIFGHQSGSVWLLGIGGDLSILEYECFSYIKDTDSAGSTQS